MNCVRDIFQPFYHFFAGIVGFDAICIEDIITIRVDKFLPAFSDFFSIDNLCWENLSQAKALEKKIV